MRFFFHYEAEEEFLKAIDYYEEVHQGLGVDFAIEVYSSIERIMAFPEAWPAIEDDIRRCLTKRILAVMHSNRDPDYWKDRI